MKYYLCQVRYAIIGESKSFVHHEYASSTSDAAEQIEDRLKKEKFVTFNVNDRNDRMILPSERVMNVVVISE